MTINVNVNGAGVIAQLFTVAQRQKAGNLLFYGLVIGLALGFSTDFVVSLAGV
jgi:hypothetical protein